MVTIETCKKTLDAEIAKLEKTFASSHDRQLCCYLIGALAALYWISSGQESASEKMTYVWSDTNEINSGTC